METQLSSSHYSSSDDQKFPSWEQTLERILATWSVPFLFPHQQLSIHYVLSAAGYFGPDEECNPGFLVSLPTGSGKSLCFMAPATLLGGITIIFYPLNALLRDQKRRFESVGAQVLLYYGGLENDEKVQALQSLRNMEHGIILTNIESAGTENFQKHLRTKNVRLIIIDEAHLILQWGKTFRSGLLKIGDLKKTFGNPVTAAFTATISEEDRKELAELLWQNENWEFLELLSDRPNISYRIIPCVDETSALRLLLRQSFDNTWDLLAARPELKRELAYPMLIFLQRRNDCEYLARQAEIWLRRWNRSDICTWYYHAGLSSRDRKAIEHDFSATQKALLFTTKAFGTGIDIPGIRSTIHIHEPETMVDFLQESGRAGRDGEPAYSYVLRKKAVLFTENSCRRRQALKVLGQEPEMCSGCDYCERIQWDEPVERKAIVSVRDSNRLRLTANEEYRLLRYEDFASLSWENYLNVRR